MKLLTIVLATFWCNQLFAQTNSEAKIDATIADARVDTLIITYDLISDKPVDLVWLEIFDGETKLNPKSITGDIGKNIVPGKNKKIIWYVKKDGIDLADHQLSVTVKAEVIIPIKIKPEVKTLAYPSLRLGIEIGAGESFKTALTMEYLPSRFLSVQSGIGFLYNPLKGTSGYNEFNNISFGSIVVPFTVELNTNSSKNFILYGGGGIQGRIAIRESDVMLHFGQGLNKNMFGIKVDAGIEIRRLKIGVSYYKDLNSYSVFDDKISALDFILGWSFVGK